MVNTSNLPTLDEALEIHQTIYQTDESNVVADILSTASQSVEEILNRIYNLLNSGANVDLTPILTSLGLINAAITGLTSTGIVVKTDPTEPVSIINQPNTVVNAALDPATIQALTDALANDVTQFKNPQGGIVDVSEATPLPVTLNAQDLNIDLGSDVLTVSLNPASLAALENITVDAVTGNVSVSNSLSDPTDPTSTIDLIVSLGDELETLTDALSNISSVVQYNNASGAATPVTPTNRLPVDVDLTGLTVNLGSGSTTLTVQLNPDSLAALEEIAVRNILSDPNDPTSTPVPLTVQLDSTSLAANPIPISFSAAAVNNLLTRFLLADGTTVQTVNPNAPLPVTLGSTGITLDTATITALGNAVSGLTAYRLPDNNIQEVSAANPLPVDVDLSGITVTLGGDNSTLQITNDTNPTTNSVIPLQVELNPSVVADLKDVTVSLKTDNTGNPIPLAVSFPSGSFDTWVNQFTNAADNSIVKVSSNNPLPVTLAVGATSPDLKVSLDDELTSLLNALNALANIQPIAFKDSTNADVAVSEATPLPIVIQPPTTAATNITAGTQYSELTADSVPAVTALNIPKARQFTVINNSGVMWSLAYPQGTVSVPPYGVIEVDNTVHAATTNFSDIAAGTYTFTPVLGTSVGRVLENNINPHIIVNYRDW